MVVRINWRNLYKCNTRSIWLVCVDKTGSCCGGRNIFLSQYFFRIGLGPSKTVVDVYKARAITTNDWYFLSRSPSHHPRQMHKTSAGEKGAAAWGGIRELWFRSENHDLDLRIIPQIWELLFRSENDVTCYGRVAHIACPTSSFCQLGSPSHF